MRNVIQMELKNGHFWLKNYKIASGIWGLRTQTRFCNTLELHQFAHYAA